MKGRRIDMKYLLGAGVGAIFGYLILYKMIGCAGGTCPITSSPFISVVYGAVMGVLLLNSL